MTDAPQGMGGRLARAQLIQNVLEPLLLAPPGVDELDVVAVRAAPRGAVPRPRRANAGELVHVPKEDQRGHPLSRAPKLQNTLELWAVQQGYLVHHDSYSVMSGSDSASG